MTRKTSAPVVAAIALTVVLLSGCSAVSTPVKKAVAEQSKVDACAKIGTALATYGTTLNSLGPTLAKDPSGALANVNSASTKFETAAAEVSNPTIKTAVVNVSNSVFTFSNELKALVDYGTPMSATVLKQGLTGLQTNIAELEAACK